MSLLLNIIWIVFGGFFIFLGYLSGGIALCLTVVGIPWGLQCFKLAIFALFPFGTETVSMRHHSSLEPLNLVLNIIWLIFGGLWVLFSHMLWGILLSITLIGIPFGLQHFKMMQLAFTPFGKTLVNSY